MKVFNEPKSSKSMKEFLKKSKKYMKIYSDPNIAQFGSKIVIFDGRTIDISDIIAFLYAQRLIFVQSPKFYVALSTYISYVKFCITRKKMCTFNSFDTKYRRNYKLKSTWLNDYSAVI